MGLDLSASSTDEGGYRLPALAVAVRPVAGCGGVKRALDALLADGGERGDAAERDGWCYLCLGADNRLYELGNRHIAAVLPAQPDTAVSGIGAAGDGATLAAGSAREQQQEAEQQRQWLEAAAVVAAHAAMLPPSAWDGLTGGCRITQGSALTATAATRLPSAAALVAVPLLAAGANGVPALAAQRARVKDIKREVSELKQDRAFLRASKQYARAAAKAGILLERAAQLREEASMPMDASWVAFEALLGVLVQVGALQWGRQQAGGAQEAASEPQEEDEQQIAGGGAQLRAGAAAVGGGSRASEAQWQGGQQPRQQPGPAPAQQQQQSGQQQQQRVHFTPLGHVARELNGQNQLWLALVLTHQAYQTLPPPQLAAAVSAVVAPEAVSRPGGWVAYPPSKTVVTAVEALEESRATLAGLQVGGVPGRAVLPNSWSALP